MFFEGLDNNHGCAARFAGVGAGSWVVVTGFCFWRIDTRVIGTVIAEELPQFLQLLNTNVVGEKPVVTDAMQARRQYVDKKAAYELIAAQGHGFVSIRPFAAIVFPLEGDAVFVTGDEAAVADGDAVGVTSEIREHGLGPGERSLGIDHPVYVA